MEKKGYVLIISVLVVAVVGTVVVITLTMLSIGATKSGQDLHNIYKAKAYANACIEVAMVRIRDNDFIGTDSIDFNDDSCTYEVNDTGGDTRELQSTGMAGGAYSRIEVNIGELTPNIVFSKYEVGEF